MESICRFIPAPSVPEIIQTINFVHEKEKKKLKINVMAMYRVYYVLEGSAVVRCGLNERSTGRDSVFFMLPTYDYEVTGSEDFEYMYISFIGLRSQAEMRRIGINSRNFVFDGCDALRPQWEKSIRRKNSVIDLESEAVLLLTLAEIGGQTLTEDNAESGQTTVSAALIKQYIDDHFTDPELTVNRMALELAYNSKYLSSLFKKQYGVGIAEYVNTMRINYACRLFDRKYRGIAYVACLSGFGDPLYFSKVFRKKVGISPRQYMERGNRAEKP